MWKVETGENPFEIVAVFCCVLCFSVCSLSQVKQVDLTINYTCPLVVIFLCLSLAKRCSVQVLISWFALLAVDVSELHMYFCVHCKALTLFCGLEEWVLLLGLSETEVHVFTVLDFM